MVKSKKMAALILAAMLAVSSSAAMAVTVSAEEDTAVAYSSEEKTWGDYDYQILDDGTVEIMHYKGYDTNLVIPSEVDGKKVTSIGELYGNKDIISVEIPNSVVNIGLGAFEDFRSLKNIIIPDSVTSIGSCAFEGCRNLTNIEIPNSVKVIGIRAFRYCISLTKIEIPDSVEYIQNFAFNHCENLKDVKIPDSVIDIGSGAFSYCKSLKDVTIPSSVTNIEGHIFNSCSNLLSINVSENNTCYSSLDGILFNKEKTELLEYPAGKSGEYVIPNDVISISGFAFGDCNNLTSIEIPDSVTSIGDHAFSNCKNLTSVIIPSSVTSIGSFYTNFSTVLTIYGCSGSSAETFAKEYDLPFVDIYSKVLTSKVGNISVKGTFDDSVILNVEKATVKNAIAAYDITLKDENGNTIQPSGEITVSIPSDKANCKVYWIKEDGTKADMNAAYNNGNYEFTTDHLSVYALITDTSKPSNESSNEQSNKPTPSESSNPNDNQNSTPSNNTNNTSNGTTSSETGKNAVNTGDNNVTAVTAIFAAGALAAVILMHKKKKA